MSTINGAVKFEWGTDDKADLRQITLAPWMGTGRLYFNLILILLKLKDTRMKSHIRMHTMDCSACGVDTICLMGDYAQQTVTCVDATIARVGMESIQLAKLRFFSFVTQLHL